MFLPDSQPAPKSAQTGPQPPPTATISPAQQSVETSLAGAPTRVPGAAAKASPLPLPAAFGRYQIEKELGKGAMGVVYLAEDTQLHRKVALKIPKQSVLEEPETLERFYREARTTATLRHNNICPVYDVGQIDGTHYLAMAYIPGKPVSSYLGKKLPPAKQVALLIRKIALALEEAHRNGVVHRDLKPSNVMLDDRGEPIVMDFGLACQLNTERNARITQSGAILGTPAYMSPEQVRGEIDNIGPRSDIYALGVMLYQFLTGELPFSGPIMMVFAQIIGQQPKKPSELKPDVDPALEAICLMMMAKDAGQRYASMKEAAAALSEYLKGGMVPAATPAVPAPLLQEPEPDPGIESLLELPTLRTIERTRRTTKPANPPATGDAARWRVRKYWPVPGLLVLGAIALFGVTIYFKNTKIKVRDESNVKTEGNKITASGPNGSNPVETTLDEQPDDGVAVTDEPLNLFNHKDLASWQQLKRAASGPDEIVPVTDWTVTSDGTLKSLGQTNGLLRYNREFGSFELSCQVKLTGDANTGIFVLLPETVGVRNPGSGFEVQLATKYHPAALIGAQGAGTGHAAKFRPVGEWNDLVVRFEAGKSLTATVDGALASDLDLKEPAYAQTPARGYVALQGMQSLSTDCEFRNLRVRELKPAQDTGTPTDTSRTQTAQDNAAGTDLLADGDFQPLFNGRDLTGWQTDAAIRSVWNVVEGQIVGTGNGTNQAQNVNPLLTARHDFHNFHLRAELKLDQGNSGLFVLVPNEKLRPCYEAEIGLVYQEGPFYRLGSLLAMSEAGTVRNARVVMPPKVEFGEWFTLEVVVRGQELTTLINGAKVIEWTDTARTATAGRIGLTNFSPNAKIAIRKLEIRELPDSTKTPLPAVAPFDAAQAKAYQEAWATHLGVPVEYVNSFGMKFRLIPPGEFVMGVGDEERAQAVADIEQIFAGNPEGRRVALENVAGEMPQRRVRLTKPFYLGDCEVTQAQYQRVVGKNPSAFAQTGTEETHADKVAGLETEAFPVEMVNWFDAAEFCMKLSQREQLAPAYAGQGKALTITPGAGYRLPTEAEWEFGCRAGSTAKFWSGDDTSPFNGIAWHWGNSDQRPHTVGTLQANPFGLFDVHGNVVELCQDVFRATGAEDSSPIQIDPVVLAGGELRTIRSSWFADGSGLSRTARRSGANPTWRMPFVGFRAALSVGGVKQRLAANRNGTSAAISSQPGQPLDGPSLLSRIELPRDRVLGDWSLQNGTLISRGTPLPKLPRVQIPITPPDAYRWEFDVEQDGSECVNLGLIVGDVQTILAVDEFPKLGHRTGLSQVDGKSALQNMSAVKGRQLPPGRNTIACVVQPADGGAYVVTLSINGKAVYQWSGKPQQLSLHEGWKVPRSDQLFLGGSSIGYRITRMELTSLEAKTSSLPSVVKPSKPDRDGWINLLGEDFPKRWENFGLPHQGDYELIDGVLKKESEIGRGIMAHDTKFTNFALQLDYRLSAVDDIARIYFRLHPSGTRPPSQALAVQLIDNRSSHSGGPNRTAKIANGALYQLAGPELPVNLPHGEWHSLEVRAVGPKITIKFNRRVVLDGSLKQIPELAADSEALNESGVIGVQYFKGHAEVRNLRVQPLDGKGKPLKE